MAAMMASNVAFGYERRLLGLRLEGLVISDRMWRLANEGRQVQTERCRVRRGVFIVQSVGSREYVDSQAAAVLSNRSQGC
jgi:hypothetical protein